MMKFLVPIVLIAFCLQTSAVNNRFFFSAKTSSLGRITTVFSDAFSVINQPALTTFSKHSAGLYFENNFAVNELRTNAIVLKSSFKNYNFGLGITRFGFDLYNESNYMLSFALPLSKEFSLGIHGNIFQIVFGDVYGRKTYFDAGISGNYIKKNGLRLGFSIYNLRQNQITDYQIQRISSIYKIGLGYELDSRVILAFETEKHSYTKALYKFGADLKVLENVYLRLGFITEPMTITAGAGFKYKVLNFDFGTDYHPYFGYTPKLALSAQW
jgi:hypothetical protein